MSANESPPAERESPACCETSGANDEQVKEAIPSHLTGDLQLCSDGLPPIISAEEFRQMHIEPPTGPLDPCDKCYGEMVEPLGN